MSDFSHSMLDEFKTQASLLLKQLHSDDADIASEAAQRFRQLPHVRPLSPAEIMQQMKRKHALQLLAYENGFEAWADFKQNLERQERLRAYRERSFYTLLYPARCAGRFTNEWHVDYEIASQELGRTGGYLLPYKNQFFICEAEYIQELGLDPDDPDWERIGWNWVRPADQDAWQRLDNKLRELSTDNENRMSS